MNVVTLFVADTKTTPVEQPIEARFDYVTVSAETAAMFRVALSNPWINSPASKLFADFIFGVVGAICQYFVRPFATSTVGGLDRGNRINERDRPLRVGNIGCGMFDGQGNPLAIGVIRWRFEPCLPRAVGFGPFPPSPKKIARTLQLSIADVLQSMTSAKPSSSSSTR